MREIKEEKQRRQCPKCPWKKNVNPYDIPNGYCEVKHQALQETIARPAEFRPSGFIKIMACHESTAGKEIPCVGWLANQLGPGNNIALRMAVMSGRINGNVETVGKQHSRFEDTLP